MFIKLSTVLCGVVFVPALAFAQARTPATTWDAIIPVLEAGQSLRVTDIAGRTRDGRLVRVTSSGVELIGRGNQRDSISQADIVRVVQKDSNANGMLLGLLGGVGAGFALGSGGCGGDSSCSAAQLAVGLPVGAGVGLFAGYLIDASSSRTLFERPGPTTVAVRPAVGKGVISASVMVGWR